jgi:hypothetical protein
MGTHGGLHSGLRPRAPTSHNNIDINTSCWQLMSISNKSSLGSEFFLHGSDLIDVEGMQLT